MKSCLIILLVLAAVVSNSFAQTKAKPRPRKQTKEITIDDLFADVPDAQPTSPAFVRVTDDKETLRGLEGVGVIIEKIDPEIERDGITTRQIQTDVISYDQRAG